MHVRSWLTKGSEWPVLRRETNLLMTPRAQGRPGKSVMTTFKALILARGSDILAGKVRDRTVLDVS